MLMHACLLVSELIRCMYGFAFDLTKVWHVSFENTLSFRLNSFQASKQSLILSESKQISSPVIGQQIIVPLLAAVYIEFLVFGYTTYINTAFLVLLFVSIGLVLYSKLTAYHCW